MRIIHAALTAGLTLSGIVWVIVRRVTPLPALSQGPTIGIALTVAAIGAMAVALTVVRPRVPPRAPELTPDAYWGDATVRMTALTLRTKAKWLIAWLPRFGARRTLPS